LIVAVSHCMSRGSGCVMPRIHITCPLRLTFHSAGPGRVPWTTTGAKVGISGVVSVWARAAGGVPQVIAETKQRQPTRKGLRIRRFPFHGVGKRRTAADTVKPRNVLDEVTLCDIHSLGQCTYGHMWRLTALGFGDWPPSRALAERRRLATRCYRSDASAKRRHGFLMSGVW
jgi:hypothetical protein